MSLYYFELIDNAEALVKPLFVECFSTDYIFAQLVRNIKKEQEPYLNFSTLVNAFSYFNHPLQYGEDLFETTKMLPDTDYEEAAGNDAKSVRGSGSYTKYKKTTNAGKISYLYSLSTNNQSNHKIYYYVKELLKSCDKTEFKWAVKIIGARKLVGEMLRCEQ